jgi:hypothetical protein
MKALSYGLKSTFLPFKHFMKNPLYLFFGLLLLTGCGKDKKNDPEPIAPSRSTAVTGLYVFTSITTDGQTYTINGPDALGSGSIDLVAVAGKIDEVTAKVTYNMSGIPAKTSTRSLQVTPSGSDYKLLDNGQKVGTVSNNVLVLIDAANTITAKK